MWDKLFDVFSSYANTDSFPHVWDKLNIPQSLAILAPTHSHLRGICKHHRSILFRTSMHSHSCVENRCVYHYIAANGESFPRMWNKRSDKWQWCDCVRLTPTFVGQKVIMPTSVGEKISVISLAFETLPHIWEIIAQNYHYSSNLKIIPTQMWDKLRTV